MKSKTTRAVAILVGTAIGAGIFGLPFAIAQIGFLPGMGYLLVLALVVLLLNLVYGEVILRTPGDHQLTGYSQIYLGSWGKHLATFSLLIGFYGALLAYLIKIGEFLSLILRLDFPLHSSLMFAFLSTVVIFRGIKAIAKIEIVLVGLIIGLIGIIGLVGLPHLSLNNLLLTDYSLTHYFLPYGVILFALSSEAAVPEMEETLRRQPKKLKKAILIGNLIPFLTYALFALIIVGICGRQTSDDAIGGLITFLPGWIITLGAFLGILTMGTSFLTVGYILREVWYRDYRLPKLKAVFFACLPPLILFLAGAKNFIVVLEVTGALTGGLTGILTLLLYQKARKHGQRQPAYQMKVPTAILWFLGLFFILGMLSPWL